ncbi:MAG: DUF4097 domain-containing protein [Deltaproteobacteria bacterium]|nr:DUF4097 domain-containing protein [Deltaproteobacteria bacterium]
MDVFTRASKWHLAAWLALLLTAPAGAFAKQREKKIPVGDLTGVEVRLTSGNVRVMAWKDDAVTVTWEDSDPLPISTKEGVLQIGMKSSRQNNTVNTDVRLLVPEHLKVIVEVISGDVEVQGFTSHLRIVTVSGNVRVAACSAAVDIETVSGDIDVQDIKGDLALRTVSGDVSGRNLKAMLVETKTVSGDLTLDNTRTKQLRMKSHSGSLHFDGNMQAGGLFESSTFSGKIDFELGKEDSFDLEAKSRSGIVHIDKGIALQENRRNYARGSHKKGGTQLRLTSFSGKIRVRIGQ